MQAVLWPELIAEWELSPQEAAVIDRQQGCTCAECGSNLRSMALAQAIKTHLDITGPFAVGLAARSGIRMLEINEAGHLTPYLRQLPGYVYGAYPDVDMQTMRLKTGRSTSLSTPTPWSMSTTRYWDCVNACASSLRAAPVSTLCRSWSAASAAGGTICRSVSTAIQRPYRQILGSGPNMAPTPGPSRPWPAFATCG